MGIVLMAKAGSAPLNKAERLDAQQKLTGSMSSNASVDQVVMAAMAKNLLLPPQNDLRHLMYMSLNTR